MIISHKYRFILFKNHKVASSSVEAAIRPHLGPKDLASSTSDGRIKEALPGLNWIDEWNGHMHPDKCKEIFPKFYLNYQKITLERNSYDKIISLYFHYKNRLSNNPNLKIDSFPTWLKNLNVRKDYLYYINDPEIKVFDYYKLDNFVNFLKTEFGFEIKLSSFNFKNNYREKLNIHTLETLIRTKKIFKNEILHFQYTYKEFLEHYHIKFNLKDKIFTFFE